MCINNNNDHNKLNLNYLCSTRKPQKVPPPSLWPGHQKFLFAASLIQQGSISGFPS